MASKSLDSLVSDIYGLLDQDNHHEPSEDNVDWLGEAVKDLVRLRLKQRDSGARGLRFSNLGKKDRQIWYENHRPELAEKMLPKTIFKFMYGDMIELLLLFLAKEAGHEVTDEQREVEVDGIKGHIDAVIDGVVVDAKSASPYAFQKFKTGAYWVDDPFGYIKQLSGYGNEIAPGKGAAFFVADKVHGDLALSHVSAETVAENPPGPRIAELKEVLKSDTPPERCYEDEPDGKSGNRKLGVNCSYCPFKFECWGDVNEGRGLRTFAYAGKPVFLTHVERTPNVQEIDPF